MLVENVIIKRVGEVKNGTSKSTGREWANREIILCFEDETGESYICAVVDENVWQKLDYKEGQMVSLNLRFRTSSRFSGYIANDIRVFIPQTQKS